jgi:hypothetical protein
MTLKPVTHQNHMNSFVLFFKQTFHTPGFGDDDLCLSDSVQQTVNSSLDSRVEVVDNVDEAQQDIYDDVQCESIDEESTTTLWMSCSPGRDSTDQEEGEDEGEEEEDDDDDDDDDDDEDDSLPLSHVGVELLMNCISSVLYEANITDLCLYHFNIYVFVNEYSLNMKFVVIFMALAQFCFHRFIVCLYLLSMKTLGRKN